MCNSLITWNCRGAGAKETWLHVQDMIRFHKPSILALLETRVSSDVGRRWLKPLGFTNLLAMEAVGFVGGIWVLWDETRVVVEEIFSHNQIVTVAIHDPGGEPWFASIIYASPNHLCRQELWFYLKKLGYLIHLPWLLIGDFNQIISPLEKHGGSPPNTTRMCQLQEVVTESRLLDLQFSGPRYTWTNCRHGRANIKQRIDRAWCNLGWHHHFAGAGIRHLPRTRSNHHPLLLQYDHRPTRERFTGFRFLQAWFQHPGFEQFVEETWKEEPGSLQHYMEKFRCKVMQWNKDTFQNIFERKKRCRARLLGVQTALDHGYRRSLAKLERSLMAEMDSVLQQEHCFWQL